jgi:hypothetical protein
VASEASVELASGVPFVSDDDLDGALSQAGVDPETAEAVVDDNPDAHVVALRVSLAVLALLASVALFATHGLPTVQAADEPERRPRLAP